MILDSAKYAVAIADDLVADVDLVGDVMHSEFTYFGSYKAVT